MTDETYNGWSNRETWAIQLHLTNNEGDYDHMGFQATETVRDITLDHDIEGDELRPLAIGRMADYIKEWTEEVFESVLSYEPGPGQVCTPTEEGRMFVADVGSWWRADFYEIAEHWIDEALESVAS